MNNNDNQQASNENLENTREFKRIPPKNQNDGNRVLKWLKAHNPMYLISVVFMLLGLYLAGTELEQGKTSVLAVAVFFAIQNVYEIIMIGMALYLLKNHIQSEHGKLLLTFVLIFMADLTFYQVRISGMHQLTGYLATAVYMILAIVKFIVITRYLEIKIHAARAFYTISAFFLIWTGPKIGYAIIDSVGIKSISYFDGTLVLYLLWLVAALIHLPVIIENWKNNNLAEHEENKYLGNATAFWRWLIVFPFVLMPVMLYVNVMGDSYAFINSSTALPVIFVPWLLASAFFAQTIWKNQFESWFGINRYDSAAILFCLVISIAFSKLYSVPVIINYFLIISALIVTCLTRQNKVSALTLSAIALWHTGTQIKQFSATAFEYGKTFSKTTWAAILMTGSFIFLGIGFLMSIQKESSENTHQE